MEESYNLWDKLKLLPAYQNSYVLSKEIYRYFLTVTDKDFWLIKSQLIRAVDSVSANIAEGYGRFYFKDKIRFYYQARGSLLEVCDWLAKASERNFLDAVTAQKFRALSDNVFKDVGILISNTKRQLNKDAD